MYLKRLRSLRIKAGLKQTDIAEILGIQQTVYSRCERGFQTIPLHFLIKLADFYNTSTDYILNRTNEIKMYPESIFEQESNINYLYKLFKVCINITITEPAYFKIGDNMSLAFDAVPQIMLKGSSDKLQNEQKVN